MDKKIKPSTKFGIWMFVIVVLIAVSFVKENNENHIIDNMRLNNESEEIIEENDNNDFKNYEVMQSNLRENNYEYVFTINASNSNKYTYTGTRCNGLESGFKEDQDGVIKYIVGYDKKAYKVVNDEYIEIDNLYDGFDGNYLIIDKIFNDLSDVLYELDMNENKAIYKYNLDDYNAIITTSKENIEIINITKGEVVYNLEFTNIGNCTKINFDK